MTSLVIQTAFIGDVILTTPLIAHLAQHGEVDVVTTPAGAALLANHPAIRRVVAYDKRLERGPGALRDIAMQVRAGSRQAVAYCAQGSMRTAALAAWAGYRERVGFDTSGGRWLYTRRVRHVEAQHHAERLLRLAVGDSTAITADSLRPRLYPGPDDSTAVYALLAGLPTDRPLVALAPGSIWGTKRWPGYPALATQLSASASLVVVGSAEDQPLAAGIAAAVPSAIDATGRLSLLASAELIRRAALLVTNDSAPQHLASAMGTPTLTIYGPTVPAFGFGPLAAGSQTIGLPDLPCRPCDHHGPPVCPLGHFRCMRDLDVTQVAGAAFALLAARHA